MGLNIYRSFCAKRDLLVSLEAAKQIQRPPPIAQTAEDTLKICRGWPLLGPRSGRLNKKYGLRMISQHLALVSHSC
jgi:hypothetical protein